MIGDSCGSMTNGLKGSIVNDCRKERIMSKEAHSSGIGFCGLLTVAFIVLRLTSVIEWSWWWVLSPLWMPLVIVLAFISLGFGIWLVSRKF